MYNDDAMIGRVVGRRELLALLGSAAAALVVGCGDNGASASGGATAGASGPATTAPVGSAATVVTTNASSAAAGGATAPAATTAAPASAGATTLDCVVRPALTEGPYFVDEKLNRSDIRSDPSDGSTRPGAPLVLTLAVLQAGATCAPLAGVTVDLWHCDASGVYSDASDPGFNTKGKKFLRGYQTTDAAGKAQFTTIYPGWYQGRAVHIHFKVRGKHANGQGYDFTSQFFFDEAMNDEVYAQAPYSAKSGRRLQNSGDDIYRQSQGQTVLKVTKSAAGYATSFVLGVQA